MQKLFFSFILFTYLLSAEVLFTGELTINLKNNSAHRDLTFTIIAQSTVWNSSHLISTAFWGGSVYYPYEATRSAVYFDLLDNNTNTISMGLGLYKIQASYNGHVDYFFVDWRTSVLIGPNSPDIAFDYDVDAGRFTLHGSNVSINTETKAVWDYAANVTNVKTGFEPASPTNLTQTASSGSAYLSWSHSTVITDDFNTGYKVYRKIENIDDDFLLIATTNSSTTSYVDNGVTIDTWGAKCYYRVKAVNGTALSGYSNEVYVLTTVLTKGKGGKSTSQMATDTRLINCYPNPFNPTTSISYTLSEKSDVVLALYDVLGNEVHRLVDENKEQGYYTTSYNAGNLSSGVYFLVLRAKNYAASQKLILLK